MASFRSRQGSRPHTRPPTRPTSQLLHYSHSSSDLPLLRGEDSPHPPLNEDDVIMMSPILDDRESYLISPLNELLVSHVIFMLCSCVSHVIVM